MLLEEAAYSNPVQPGDETQRVPVEKQSGVGES